MLLALRPSLATVVCLAVVAASAPARADEEVLVRDGEVPTDDDVRFVELPFEVPEGIVELEVRHDDLSESNILDWGLSDPLRNRGWGGGNTEPAVVGVEAASRSYLPGPLPAGTWRVRIGEAKLVELPARYHVEIVLRDAPTLPPQPERTPWAPGPALATGPRWWAGDLHVHSRESGDADPTIDEIAAYARGRGLDFVELSDHNTVSQLELMVDAQARNPEVLLVPGVEYTTYQGHANGIGATEWVDHAVGLGGVTIQGAARAFADQGAIFSINHPTLDLQDFCIGCAWTWDLPARWIGGVEISTGGWSESGWLLSPPATELWDELSRQGHHTTAVGGSDDHSAGLDAGAFQSPIGDPTTMVWADELSVPAILAGIRAGRTVVKLQGPDDPMIELGWSVPPVGDTVSAAHVTLTVQVTGGGDRLMLVRNGETAERVDIDADPFLHDFELDAPATGEDFVRAVVVLDDAPRTVTSNVWLRTGAGAPPAPARLARGGGCAVTVSGRGGPPSRGGLPLLVVLAGGAVLARRRRGTSAGHGQNALAPRRARLRVVRARDRWMR